MNRNRVRTLSECSVLLAAATLLSMVVIFRMVNDGAVTLCSMVPIFLIAFRYSVKWAVLAATAFGGLQMVILFYPPPVKTVPAFACVVLLDYVIAFGVLGLAGWFGRPFTGYKKMIVGTGIAVFLRFLCHFVSGIIIWKSFSTIQPVWLYSLVYNGSFLSVDYLIALPALIAVMRLPLLRREP